MLENAIATAPSSADARTNRSLASQRSTPTRLVDRPTPQTRPAGGSSNELDDYWPWIGAPTAWNPPSTCTISPLIARA